MHVMVLRPQLMCKFPLLCIHLVCRGFIQGVSAVMRVVSSMSQSLAELRF